jgi:hypothetical protein
MHTVKKRILIPRKDHEIYFIRFPANIKRKNLSRYISDKLLESHPGYSSSSVFDFKNVKIDKTVWLMITVMENEILTEYRILNPGAAFFTNTGILVYGRDFINRPKYYFSTETIGYNKETGEPVSLPYINHENITTLENEEYISQKINSIKTRYSVYRKSDLLILYIFLAAISVFSLSLLVYWKFQPPGSEIPGQTASAEAVETIEVKTTPSPFMMLAEISHSVLQTNGTIYQWQYNENNDPSFILSINGSDTTEIYESLRSYSYLKPNNISEVQYISGNPAYTLTLSLINAQYSVPQYRAFRGREDILPALSLLRTNFSKLKAEIISETLPSETNRYSVCTLNAGCEAEDFITALEAVEDILFKESMRIQFINLSLNTEKDVFNFTFSFAPVDTVNYSPSLINEYKETIPVAFGYRKVIPKAVPVFTQKARPVELVPETLEYTKIGKIINEEGGSIIYFRNKEGKIITREE